MLTKVDPKNIKKIKAELAEFVWDFKHGDNILFNFEVLQALYEADAKSSNRNILNKPITITIVSIIEAILIDFLTRIDQATTHLPSNVDRATLRRIKHEIESKKVPTKTKAQSSKYIYLRRKMYQFNEIISIFKKYELFGLKNDSIYQLLGYFGDLRNRVHIENYHRNFEEKERYVFTSERLAKLENVLAVLWNKMISDYKRPWKRI